MDRQRAFDRVRSRIFKGDNAIFMGSIMGSMEYVWDPELDPPTAATDGKTMWWHPGFFYSIPEASRYTVLLHELGHPARLHGVRRGARDPKIWNWACDIRINNDLENEGRSFVGIENCWKDQSVDKDGLLSEEQIYDLLVRDLKQGTRSLPQTGSWGQGAPGSGDLLVEEEPLTKQEQKRQIEVVMQAVQLAKMAKQAGTLVTTIEEKISEFLNPIVPWQPILRQFLTDLDEEDYSWSRPNRRYQDMYLPSRLAQEGRLAHLAWFMDVSLSVEPIHLKQFSAEFKYVHDILRPQKMTLIQFSSGITKVEEYDEHRPFEELKATGRGGTNLRPVHAWIEKHRPTAAIIFTDLEVPPMERLKSRTPIIWIVVDNPNATVPFGRLVHVPPERR